MASKAFEDSEAHLRVQEHMDKMNQKLDEIYDLAAVAVRQGYGQDEFVEVQLDNWENSVEFRGMSSDQRVTLTSQAIFAYAKAKAEWN